MLKPPPHKKKKPWKKLLYLKQSYPDNYTDESFLSQLKRNTTVTKYSILKLIKDFSLIILHLSNLMLVILVFYGFYNLNWDPLKITLVSTTLSILGFIIIDMYSSSPFFSSKPKNIKSKFKSKIKSSILLIFILLVLSPVLKSLTKSSSSDSIWALSSWLCILNILFHDYAIDLNKPYKPIISTNLSLSNSIVLASRLNSTLLVFSFILFSIQINILLPLFDFFLRKNFNFNKHLFLLVITVLGVYFAIGFIWGKFYLVCWILLHFCIVILGPLYFLGLQKYKNELQGPWDPARPIINNNL